MVSDRPRQGAGAGHQGRILYESAVRQARAPALYAAMGTPDTVEGRFELLTLHVIILLARLRGDHPTADAVRQAVFDAYISDLDGALREMGVGDLSVGKRMKSLGAAFYGRAEGYDRAMEALPKRDDLEALIRRTALENRDDGDSIALADYVLRCRAALAATGLEELLTRGPSWPEL